MSPANAEGARDAADRCGRVASATFCRTEELTGIFTDADAPEEMVVAPERKGIKVTQHG